jgi:hypothetical protein
VILLAHQGKSNLEIAEQLKTRPARVSKWRQRFGERRLDGLRDADRKGRPRHGTTTLFAAFDIATGQVIAGHYHRRRRREFLDFMNQIVAAYPDRDIHVVLDNLNTHKPK